MATGAQRQQLRTFMDWSLVHAAKIHYPPGDRRTEAIHWVASMQQLVALVVPRPQGLTIDCSQFVELGCHVAGLHDPNGHAYAFDGYTGTLLSGPCPHYTNARLALVGAIVVFGPYPGHHTAFVYEADPVHGDPLLCSQGSELDPRLIRLSAEVAGQPAPVTFLSIAHL